MKEWRGGRLLAPARPGAQNGLRGRRGRGLGHADGGRPKQAGRDVEAEA